MRPSLVAYVTALVVFLASDAVWLGLVARGFYAARLGDLLAPRPNLAAAAAFYLLYPAGVVIFAVAPALRAGTWSTAALYGALLGLFAYATYDLTNLATLRGWSLLLSITDLAWGTVLTAFAATAAALVAARFG